MKPVPASVEARDERFTAVSNSASSSTKGEDNEEYSSSNVSDADITRKKKTPMCLINELARHHKLQPQYRLTEESGPAHLKTFIVNLKLGDEEYTASGQSIKKAQHAAAQLALENTNFQPAEPKPKMKNQPLLQASKPVTPTVELNALTMKLNLSPVYTLLPPTPVNSQTCSAENSGRAENPQAAQDEHFASADYQNRFAGITPRFQPFPNHQRYFYNRFPTVPMIYHVSLTVGKVFVTGEGSSPQAARHHAASQALQQLNSENSSVQTTCIEETSLLLDADSDSLLKSPVSLIHELALKLNQTVEFSVVSESGPPHMKNFIVECKLGDYLTKGDGNCKKLAKKKASELMLDEMKKIHLNGMVRCGETNPPRLRPKSKSVAPRKKPRNLVKEVTSASNSHTGAKPQDPISYLVQLQQGRKEKEPVFSVISERGIPRQPEFVVQVTVGSLTATGMGAKKKDAKRAAAKKALESLGVAAESTQIEADAITSATCVSSALPDVDSTVVVVPGRQTIPGLLILGATQGNRAADEAKDSPPPSNNSQAKVLPSVGSETRLRYLAKIMNYEVDFSDFPQGNSGDILSLVTLNTTPTSVCHAVGSTPQEAHDNAAASILKLIADGGINMSGQENASKSDETVQV